MHNGFVTINEEKMSKSLGNFFTIQDLLRLFHPEAIRLFLLSSHYRSPIDFSDQYVAEAYKSLARFYDLLARAIEMGADINAGAEPDVKAKFMELMDDDFNTATAIAFLNSELRRLNQVRADMEKMKKASDGYKNALSVLFKGVAGMKELGGVLGLFSVAPAEFMEKARGKKLEEAGLTQQSLTAMIEERLTARYAKDFKRADEIRDELAGKGVLLHDTPQGVTWSVKFE
jgi:cysteinyl-tRNA synthetase